jgi:hypothetical protein
MLVNIGCWRLAVGPSAGSGQAIGCWRLAVGAWLLALGCWRWLLALGCWLLVNLHIVHINTLQLRSGQALTYFHHPSPITRHRSKRGKLFALPPRLRSTNHSWLLVFSFQFLTTNLTNQQFYQSTLWRLAVGPSAGSRLSRAGRASYWLLAKGQRLMANG